MEDTIIIEARVKINNDDYAISYDLNKHFDKGKISKEKIEYYYKHLVHGIIGTLNEQGKIIGAKDE